MSITKRLYKYFMVGMILATIGMLLAMGIIAIQKSMKVNLSFQANPNFLFELYIQKPDEATKNLVFRNFEKSATEGIVMQNGLSTLSGNKLSADGTFFSTYGDEFSIIIANFTTTMGIDVAITSTATLESGAAGVPAEITTVASSAAKYSGEGDAAEVKYTISNKAVFPQKTWIEITFEEYKPAISFVLTNGSTTVENGTKLPMAGEYSVTIQPELGCFLPVNPIVTGVSSDGYTWDYSTGLFSITDWSKVTGGVTLTVESAVYRFNEYSNSNYTAPAAREDNTFYKYYCEFGSYPQSYVGTDASIVSGMAAKAVTYATDNSVTFYSENGINKYAAVNVEGTICYYAFEPIRWIVIGEDRTGGITFSGSDTAPTVASTTSTLFTASTSGLTLENNRIKLNGTEKTNLLFLSELALDNDYFDASWATNRWADTSCDVRLFLNNTTNDMTNFASISGLLNYYDSVEGSNTSGKFIQKTKVEKTSYDDNLEGVDNGYYNMFLLGSNYQMDAVEVVYYYDVTDSYNMASYFPLNSSAHLGAQATPYNQACGFWEGSSDLATVNDMSGGGWWTRSGNIGEENVVEAVNSIGNHLDTSVATDRGLRPCFTFNLF